MAKFKHNKLKNTGMLFEFLLRQVTVDVLNKKKDSPALKIIKSRFNENFHSPAHRAILGVYRKSS